jgi:hypothetical protein
MGSHEEHAAQAAGVKICRMRWPILNTLMWAIPNGEERPKVLRVIKGKKIWTCPSGQRAKEEGQLKGVWDLMVAVSVMIPTYPWGKNGSVLYRPCPGLIIEMKSKAAFKRRNCGLTDEQIEYRNAMYEQGWRYEVCDSANSMVEAVEFHMKDAGY